MEAEAALRLGLFASHIHAVITEWFHAQRNKHKQASTWKNACRQDSELTALYMKQMDVSEKDRIRDILWLKGWLGGCCRCTYSTVNGENKFGFSHCLHSKDVLDNSRLYMKSS